jgi:hypothetical protein
MILAAIEKKSIKNTTWPLLKQGGVSPRMKKFFLTLSLVLSSLAICQADSTKGLMIGSDSAATYYLDADGGSDSNSGTSPAVAWQTLAHASKQTFQPGDQILLQRGDTFVGTLLLDDESGTAVAPIIVGSYGTGDLPVINAAGYLAGVHIRDVAYIEVQDIEITADGGTVMDGSAGLGENHEWNAAKARYGVYVNGITGTLVAHVTLRNLYIHDIFPTSDRNSEGANPTTYWGYGIKFSGSSLPSDANGFKDADGLSAHFLVENCTIERTGHRGIHALRVHFLNIIDNVLTDIGGPGIQPSLCDDMVVRGNVVTRPGSYVDTRMHGRGSGIWPWGCERILIEKNTFRGARGRGDSCGAHIDWDCSHVVVQYNLSIDNSGGFLEILGGTYNNTYRYNISINDGLRLAGVVDQGRKPNDKDGQIIWISGYRGTHPHAGPTHSYVYNNTIYVGTGTQRTFQIQENASGVLIANNIFYIECHINTIDITPGALDDYSQSMIDSIVWDNNLYQRTGIIPSTFPFAESPQTIGDPLFVNKGGLAATDYIPMSVSLIVDQGISITALAGDRIGLEVGLSVTEDFFGNPVVGLPDMGAVEIQVIDSVIN